MRTYLALCRFPAVFTALADIFLGYSLGGGPVWTPRFVLALLASAGLYLGGMVLNDLLDEKKDAVERPERPIPSGRVSKRSAWIFYLTLTLVGLSAAGAIGIVPLGVAAALVALIWLYDGPLKRTPLGPLAMGTCRTGNILLGVAAGGMAWSAVFDQKTLWVAAAMGVYICGLTLFAKREAGEPSRGWLVVGWLIINAGLAAAIAWAGWYRAESAEPRLLLGFIVIVLLINYRLSQAIVAPSPRLVQTAVRSMLLSIPVLNASLIAMAVGNHAIWWAAATAALVLPAALVGRFLKLT